MNYVILDLEFNGTYSKRRHKFFNEIIEFGAVKVDEQLNIIDTFSELISPQISKKLNTHVSALTHITYKELSESKNTFTHVLSLFRKFLSDSLLMTWGTSDILVLMENCGYYLGNEELTFLKNYCNLQAYCQEALDYHDRSKMMGLSTCAELIGVNFEKDSLHRALSDARLSYLCFQKLFDRTLLSKLTEPVGEEFYRKITFKNYAICDLKDPNVDRREMFIICDRCQRKARRKSRWHIKNKSFRARFRCPKCKRDFEGRITFKRTYSGVNIDKRIAELPKPAEP